MSFKSLGLSAKILEQVAREQFKEATAVQQKAIPLVLKGNDLLVIAPTGSGKTASYVLPLLEKVLASGASKHRHIKALILVPTRELAIQVHQVVQTFSTSLERKIKSMVVYGGVSINPQMMGLHHVEILVATPGRLIDLVEHNALQLSSVSTFILDEADKLLNLGFQREFAQIEAWLPKQRQNILLSATLNKDLQALQALILHDAQVVEVEAETVDLDLIRQKAFLTSDERKGPLLRYLIKQQNFDQVLIFTSSGNKAEQVAGKLAKNGISASPIHGKLSQDARTTALRKFKAKEIKALVATDLLSRGIDIEALDLVINYELPRSPKDYIHRIGRTGRAGASGLAISILTEADLHHFKIIQKKMGKQVEVEDSGEINLHGY